MIVFLECFKNYLISIVDQVYGAASALAKLSSRLTIQCNIAEAQQN